MSSYLPGLSRQITALFTLAAAGHAQTAAEFPTEVVLGSAIHDAVDVQASDVDGDGLIDLVGLSQDRNELTWMRNVGTGAAGAPDYGTARTLAVLPSALDTAEQTFAAADLSGDGLDDYVATSADGLSLLYVQNQPGGGAINPVTVFTSTGPGASTRRPDIALFDLDGDGDLDVFAVLLGSQPGVLLENTGATLVVVPNGAPDDILLQDVAPADLDGDGDTDLAAASTFEQYWIRNVNGTLVVEPDLAGSSGFDRVDAVDLDGDGDQDLAYWTRSEVRLHENLSGQGTFGAPVDHELATGSSAAGSLAFLDMDRDGDPDLVTTGGGERRVRWSEILPGLALAAPVSIGTELTQGIRSISVADVNQDGLPDLLLARTFSRLTGFLGQAAGQLAVMSTPTDLTRRFGSPIDADYLDYDQDGLVDLLITSRGGGALVARRDGAGGFLDAEAISPNTPEVRVLGVYELDGDGLPDVLLQTESREVQALFGLAGGGFAPALVISNAPSIRGTPVAVDLDQDGDLDIVVGDEAGPSLLAFDQIAPGQFLTIPRLLAAVDGIPRLIEAADLDADGLEDVVLTTKNETTYVYRHYACENLGNGAINARLVQTIVDASGPERLVPADLDGDTDLDLVWIDVAGDRLTGRLNLGSFAFSSPVLVLDAGDRIRHFQMAQLNTDGVADIVIEDLTSRSMARTMSNGALNYGALEPLTLSFGPMIPAPPVDLDGDGDLDMVGCWESPGLVVYFESELFGDVGTSECGPAVSNSTGGPGAIEAIGSSAVAERSLRVHASGLPPWVLTLFITSRNSGFVPGVGGSVGNLCLGANVGRFLGPGEAQLSTASGTAQIDVSLDAIPQPNGAVSVLAGNTWRFQAWHRDLVGGALVSNFTDATRVTFL